MPLAVRELDQATADFSKMGFTLKPGRPHGDGIRNAHVKFSNGTEIELITAKASTDALAKEYEDWIRRGDGAAFWSLYGPDLALLTTRLSSLGLDPSNGGDLVTFPQTPISHRLFFADRLRSPTDKAAYYLHANTAYQLSRVWISYAAPERRLMKSFGVRMHVGAICAPFGAWASTAVLPGGDEVAFVSGLAPTTPDRTIIGATVKVRSLEAAERQLTRSQIVYEQVAGCGGGDLWVRTHGAWLEFSQADR